MECGQVGILRIPLTVSGLWSRRTSRPAAPGGRPRSTCMRAVLDALLYLLRTGCQWRQFAGRFPALAHRARLLPPMAPLPASCLVSAASSIKQARVAAGRRPWPTVAVMDAQSAKTTGRGGVRGFDGYKRVKRGASATSSSTRSAYCFPSACSRPMRRTSRPAPAFSRVCTAMASCPDHLRRRRPRGTRLGERAVSARGRGIADRSARRPSLLSRDRPHMDCRATSPGWAPTGGSPEIRVPRGHLREPDRACHESHHAPPDRVLMTFEYGL